MKGKIKYKEVGGTLLSTNIEMLKIELFGKTFIENHPTLKYSFMGNSYPMSRPLFYVSGNLEGGINEAEIEIEIDWPQDLEDLSHLFENSWSLKELEINNWSSNVKNTSYMFNNCGYLEYVNLLSLNMMNVTDISHMFENCKKLIVLTSLNWDTRNIKDMSYLFSVCENLILVNGLDHGIQ